MKKTLAYGVPVVEPFPAVPTNEPQIVMPVPDLYGPPVVRDLPGFVPAQ